MNEKLTIEEIFKVRSKQLCATLGMPIRHPVSKGDLSENEWIAFLKSFLPNRYDVSKGFIFDSKGNVSDQIDLIIFDPFHSPLILTTDNGEKYITAESVYAVFEVKQKTNKANLEYANRKIESVKKLHRTQRSMISSGKIVPPRELTNIIGGLLTTDSVSKNNVITYMKSLGNIDLVCAAEEGTYYKYGNDIVASSNEEAVFAFFFLILDELFKLGTIGAIDIREYADASLNTFKIERGEM